MKKSLNINLSGIVFHIDEDAYELLGDYLASLQRHYSHSEDGAEIITDIEARIAEILQEKLANGRTVVTIREVGLAIEMIGRPEEIFEDEEPQEEYTQQQHTHYEYTAHTEAPPRAKHRKLFRDPDERYLAGVAAGLAHFIGVPPLYVRIGFVVLQFFYGFGIFVYVAMWAFVKEAKTSAQKLEMRGEEINLSNIEKTIRDEFENVKKNVSENLKNVEFERYARHAGDGLRNVLEGVYIFLKGILRFIGIIIGIVFAIGGTLLLTSLIAAAITPNLPFIPGVEGHEIAQRIIGLFLPHENVMLATIAVLILIGIPLMGLVYSGIKIIFRPKTKDKAIVFASFILWIIGVGLTAHLALNTAKEYSSRSYVDQATILGPSQPDTLVLKLSQQVLSDELQHGSVRIGNIRVLERNDAFVGKPTFDIKKSKDGELKIEVEKSAFGRNKKLANDNAKQIDYLWTKEDNLLFFNHYFKVEKAERWLDQSIKIVLRLPVGKVVYLDESLVKIIFDIKNLQNMWDGHMGGKYWIMTDRGLSLLNPEQHEKQIVWQETVQEEVEREMKQAAEEIQKEMEEVAKEMEEAVDEIKVEIENDKNIRIEIKTETDKKPETKKSEKEIEDEFNEILKESQK